MSRLIRLGNWIFVLFFYLVCIVVLKNMISESYLTAILLFPVLYIFWHLYKRYQHANLNLRMDEMIKKYRVPMWCILQLLSFFIMVAMTFKLRVNFSWDWGQLISTAVTKVLTGEWKDTEYYVRYPNNKPWLLCLTAYFKFVQMVVPAATEETFYVAAIFLSIAFTQITFLLLYQTARLLFSERQAFLVGIVGLIGIPFYLYAQFAYTDTVSMMLVIGLTYIYLKMSEGQVKRKRSGILFGLLLTILSVLIFNIKVLCFIAVIAMILDSILNCNNHKKLVFILIICCALGGVGNKVISIIMNNELSITSEMSDQNEYPWLHWIMMGMNHYGGYSHEDVVFSYNAGDYEEKKAAEVQELKRRIMSYGTKGTLNHLFYTKLSRTWGYSCLAGDDYCHRSPYHEKSLWQRLFGAGEDLHWIVLIYTWLYHILMLWGMFFEGVYSLKVADERNAKFMVLRYTVLGAGIFLTIWECNSRYLFPFLPVMILLEARGWQTVLLKSSDKKYNVTSRI